MTSSLNSEFECLGTSSHKSVRYPNWDVEGVEIAIWDSKPSMVEWRELQPLVGCWLGIKPDWVIVWLNIIILQKGIRAKLSFITGQVDKWIFRDAVVVRPNFNREISHSLISPFVMCIYLEGEISLISQIRPHAHQSESIMIEMDPPR